MRRTSSLLIVAIATLLLAAKPALDFRDTTWTFPAIDLKLKVKIPGFGSASCTAPGGPLVVTVDAGCPTFTLNLDGMDVMSGALYRKDPFNSKLVLASDPASLTPFFDMLETEVEAAAAAEGFTWDLELNGVDKEKIQMPVKVRSATQTATPRIAFGLFIEGTLSGTSIPGTVDIVLGFKAKATGMDVPSTDLL